MRAFTVYQPWASALALGIKAVETRGHKPPSSVLGKRVAIHAAKRPIPDSIRRDEVYLQALLPKCDVGDLSELPRGVVLATAKLADARCVLDASQDGKSVWVSSTAYDGGFAVAVDPLGDFSVGRWLWFLRDVRQLETPAPARGMQGFWEWMP